MGTIGGNWKDLFKACETDDIKLACYHLQKNGVDVNFQHPEYMTAPIHEAIRCGHLNIVKLLVDEFNADIMLDEELTGDKPLDIALAYKRHDIVDFLLKAFEEGNCGMPDRSSAVRNVLITGGNRGIGKAIAYNLLDQGHRVVITGRSEDTIRETAHHLKQETGNSKISYVVGDLSSIESTQELVAKIRNQFPTINVLINNAGVWPTKKVINKDGLEMAFMVNYLAPYILSHSLLPDLKRNHINSRIILINSGLFMYGTAQVPTTTPFGQDFNSFRSYASTKQCGVYFMLDFAKQIEDSGITINAVHPGAINTGLGEQNITSDTTFFSFTTYYLLRFLKAFWKDPAYGSLAPSWLAVSPEVQNMNGIFFNEKEQMEFTVDHDFQHKLTAWTKHFLEERS